MCTTNEKNTKQENANILDEGFYKEKIQYLKDKEDEIESLDAPYEVVDWDVSLPPSIRETINALAEQESINTSGYLYELVRLGLWALCVARIGGAIIEPRPDLSFFTEGDKFSNVYPESQRLNIYAIE